MANTMLWANNASSALAYSIISTSTTLQVNTGTGILFPQPGVNQYFILTINDIVNNIIEIVQVNSVQGDTFYVTRGQENTVPQNFNAGVQVENRITAGTLEYLTGLVSGSENSLIVPQTTASNKWIITHNLNKYPNIAIYDSNSSQIITDYIYVDLNNVEIFFSQPVAGYVYVS